MFPEIVRDEVFRLETRRLWLRWPTMADAFDTTAEVPKATSADTQRPGMACVAAWRSSAERGEALHLMLDDKGTRAAVGSINLTVAAHRQGRLDYRLAPAHRGQGLMTEAVQAVVHLAFLLDLASVIAASPLASDSAGRGVLERCGFTYAGSGMRSASNSQGLTACDHFRLDRRTWSSLRGWGSPGFSGARSGLLPTRVAVSA
jgi:RimJ/RimL family protein N-acetyltransferase